MKKLLIAGALFALIASPAFAQNGQPFDYSPPTHSTVRNAPSTANAPSHCVTRSDASADSAYPSWELCN